MQACQGSNNETVAKVESYKNKRLFELV